jgi:hypothetical protein
VDGVSLNVFVPKVGWTKMKSVGRGSNEKEPLICPGEKVFNFMASPVEVLREISTCF